MLLFVSSQFLGSVGGGGVGVFGRRIRTAKVAEIPAKVTATLSRGGLLGSVLEEVVHVRALVLWRGCRSPRLHKIIN